MHRNVHGLASCLHVHKSAATKARGGKFATERLHLKLEGTALGAALTAQIPIFDVMTARQTQGLTEGFDVDPGAVADKLPTSFVNSAVDANLTVVSFKPAGRRGARQRSKEGSSCKDRKCKSLHLDRDSFHYTHHYLDVFAGAFVSLVSIPSLRPWKGKKEDTSRNF